MTNKTADSIFLNSKLYIDVHWGLSILKQYTDEIDLVEKGVPYAELGISRKREAALSQLMEFEEGFVKIVKLTGAMTMQGGLSTNGATAVADQIRSAQSEGAGAILLEMDSGGGEALAAQEVFNAVKDASIPVVSYGHFVASGAYWAALSSDKIIASGNTSEFGSIGVYTRLNKKFVEFYKENYEDIYSKDSPKKNNEFREYLKGNKEPFIDMLNQADSIFMNLVKTHRNLTADTEKTSLSGEMFFAEDALERGMIDGIMTKQEAISFAYSLQNTGSNKIKKIDNNMEKALITGIQKFFGISADATPEEVEAAFENIQPLANAATIDLAPINTQISGLRTELTSLSGTVEGINIEALAEASGSNTEAIAAMQTSLAEIEGLKTKLETLQTTLTGALGAEVSTSNSNPLKTVAAIESEIQNISFDVE